VKTGETHSSSCEYNRMTRSSLPLNTFDWNGKKTVLSVEQGHIFETS